MKKIVVLFLWLVIHANVYAQSAPVSIIIDTDIAPDYDDVGAMAMLHAFANRGEATILATIACNTFYTTAPTLSVLNTYFQRPEIPVGVTKGRFPNKKCGQEWAQFIVKKYPSDVRINDQGEEAVRLYRRILALQPDQSVTIVSIGFFTNLANLLNSVGDRYSPLNGDELVAKKVKQLVSMAGSVGEDGKGGEEFNVAIDANASQIVFENWPTPIILSGLEIGEKILTGTRLIADNSITNSPVKDAYTVALKADRNTIGRSSWDQTAVLVAVRGIEPWFSERKINFEITKKGESIPIPGEKFSWLTFKQSPQEIAKVIEELMMQQPTAKK